MQCKVNHIGMDARRDGDADGLEDWDWGVQGGGGGKGGGREC